MLHKEFRRKEISRRLSRRLGFVLTVELAAGLLLSIGVIAVFAEIVEEVVEGESRFFDEAVLLWIKAHFPDWLDGPMLFFTALGYYWVVLPLLALAVYTFHRLGARISAALLLISTAGGLILTITLKSLLQRTRPELFDSGYTTSLYSFPSAHATVAAGFYGTLALLLAWRLTGFLALGGRRIRHPPRPPHRLLAPLPRRPLPDGHISRLPGGASLVSVVGIAYFLWRAL